MELKITLIIILNLFLMAALITGLMIAVKQKDKLWAVNFVAAMFIQGLAVCSTAL